MKPFEELVGEDHLFYGVDSDMFKLGWRVFEAIEDESDGLRSYFGCISYVGLPDMVIFRNQPLATVKIEEVIEDAAGEDGWRLVDVEDQHVWLEVGTDYSEDCYPCFYFRYHPKEPKV